MNLRALPVAGTWGRRTAARPVRASDSVHEGDGAADAIEALQSTLLDEVGRRRQLELELVDLRTALATSNEALARLRVGERQARHEAGHDALTALPNRRHFSERLRQALEPVAARRPVVAVLFIDLDDFKPVNDFHGHATGDELLRILATRLAHAVRAEDVVSRVGGDEFACLIARMPDPALLDALARKLIETVSAPVLVGDRTLCVRPSIGLAVSPFDGTAPDVLLRRADAAMYRAKRLRAGHARFDPLLDDPDRVAPPSTSR